MCVRISLSPRYCHRKDGVWDIKVSKWVQRMSRHMGSKTRRVTTPPKKPVHKDKNNKQNNIKNRDDVDGKNTSKQET